MNNFKECEAEYLLRSLWDEHNPSWSVNQSVPAGPSLRPALCYRWPHVSCGGNWSTSPTSLHRRSPSMKASLYRRRTLSCDTQKDHQLPAVMRGSEILCVLCISVLIMSPTFVGLASNMIWVMEAGGRMGLNGASSVPDGGCSFTFIDWWRVKGRVSTIFWCL